MAHHCNFQHKKHFKIIYQKGVLPFTEYFVCQKGVLPFTEYFVCQACYDSGMPWANPRAIISKRVIEVEKTKEE